MKSKNLIVIFFKNAGKATGRKFRGLISNSARYTLRNLFRLSKAQFCCFLRESEVQVQVRGSGEFKHCKTEVKMKKAGVTILQTKLERVEERKGGERGRAEEDKEKLFQ